MFLGLGWAGDPESEVSWALDLNLDGTPLEVSFGLWRRVFLGILLSGEGRVEGRGYGSEYSGIRVGWGSSLGLLEDFLVRGLVVFSLTGESVRPVDCLLDAFGKSAESRLLLLFGSMFKHFYPFKF